MVSWIRQNPYCLLILICFSLLLFFPNAQVTAQQKRKSDLFLAQATILSKDEIEIDGKLEEASWAKASVLTNFTQQNPKEGAPATEKTEVRILYGKDFLYVGVRAFDSEPEKIKAILARRDSSPPSDWIRIWIDSYHDHRTAFEFAVNPSGVKRDVSWTDDSKTAEDWDAVWDVEVSLDEEGWSAEFRIPFSQLRFPEKRSQIWGLQVGRIIARKNELIYWRHVPKGIPKFVSLFGDLKGLKKIPAPRRLQLLPYSMGRSSIQPVDGGNPFQNRSSYFAGLGLDLKYGLTSNLTLDATFNPDFGQVEADPAQINLTAYETYFPEKRPFFIEGNNIINFPLGGGTARESLLYSRRIGRPPQRDLSSAQYFKTPESTTIISAIKLTGKTTQGWSIGLMEALTGREKAKVMTWENVRTKETVEPLTNYFLGRIEKDFREGRSALGLIFTAVNRKLDEESLNFLRKAAYAGGFDFRHRLANDTYEVSGDFIWSHILGSRESILLAQQSSAHNFQRPDATHIEVDPTRTSLSGFSSSFSLSKIGGGHWRWSMAGLVRSPGFEVNDMGYLMYADWINQTTQVSYKEYKPGKVFREYEMTLSFHSSWDYATTLLDERASLSYHFQFLNYWSINLDLSRSQERFSVDYLRGGPAVLMPGNWRLGGGFATDPRKAFSLDLNGNISVSDNGSKSYGLSSGITLRPSARINLSLLPSFSNNFQLLQYVTEISSQNQTHYILSRIDQTTASLTLRMNYTLTPNLSLQLYTQPYVSAGKYSEFKEVIHPRAKNYRDRWHLFSGQEISFQDGYYHLFLKEPKAEELTFENPNFNFRQFRLNLVIRWEYLPGSILFLVWSSGINDDASDGTFSLRNDFQNLFRRASNNVFLLKISYWFNI